MTRISNLSVILFFNLVLIFFFDQYGESFRLFRGLSRVQLPEKANPLNTGRTILRLQSASSRQKHEQDKTLFRGVSLSNLSTVGPDSAFAKENSLLNHPDIKAFHRYMQTNHYDIFTKAREFEIIFDEYTLDFTKQKNNRVFHLFRDQVIQIMSQHYITESHLTELYANGIKLLFHHQELLIPMSMSFTSSSMIVHPNKDIQHYNLLIKRTCRFLTALVFTQKYLYELYEHQRFFFSEVYPNLHVSSAVHSRTWNPTTSPDDRPVGEGDEEVKREITNQEATDKLDDKRVQSDNDDDTESESTTPAGICSTRWRSIAPQFFPNLINLLENIFYSSTMSPYISDENYSHYTDQQMYSIRKAIYHFKYPIEYGDISDHFFQIIRLIVKDLLSFMSSYEARIQMVKNASYFHDAIHQGDHVVYQFKNELFSKVLFMLSLMPSSITIPQDILDSLSDYAGFILDHHELYSHVTFHSIDFFFDVLAFAKNDVFNLRTPSLNFSAPSIATAATTLGISSPSSSSSASTKFLLPTSLPSPLLQRLKQLMIRYLPGSPTYRRLHEELVERDEMDQARVDAGEEEDGEDGYYYGRHMRRKKRKKTTTQQNERDFNQEQSPENEDVLSSLSSTTSSASSSSSSSYPVSLHQYLYLKVLRCLSSGIFSDYQSCDRIILKNTILFFREQLSWLTDQSNPHQHPRHIRTLDAILRSFLFLHSFHKNSPFIHEMIHLFFSIYPFPSKEMIQQRIEDEERMKLYSDQSSSSSSSEQMEKKRTTTIHPIALNDLEHISFHHFLRVYKQIISIYSIQKKFIPEKYADFEKGNSIVMMTRIDEDVDEDDDEDNNHHNPDRFHEDDEDDGKSHQEDEAEEAEERGGGSEGMNRYRFATNFDNIQYDHETFKEQIFHYIYFMFHRVPETPLTSPTPPVPANFKGIVFDPRPTKLKNMMDELVMSVKMLSTILVNWKQVPNYLQELLEPLLRKNFIYEKDCKSVINFTFNLVLLKHPDFTCANIERAQQQKNITANPNPNPSSNPSANPNYTTSNSNGGESFYELFLQSFYEKYKQERLKSSNMNLIYILRLLKIYRFIVSYDNPSLLSSPGSSLQLDKFIPLEIQNIILNDLHLFLSSRLTSSMVTLRNLEQNYSSIPVEQIIFFSKLACDNNRRLMQVFHILGRDFPQELSQQSQAFQDYFLSQPVTSSGSGSGSGRGSAGNSGGQMKKNGINSSASCMDTIPLKIVEQYHSFVKKSYSSSSSSSSQAIGKDIEVTPGMITETIVCSFPAMLMMLTLERWNPFHFHRSNAADCYQVFRQYSLPIHYFLFDPSDELNEKNSDETPKVKDFMFEILLQQYSHQAIFPNSFFELFDYILDSNEQMMKRYHKNNKDGSIRIDEKKRQLFVRPVDWSILPDYVKELILFMIEELLKNNKLFATLKIIHGNEESKRPSTPFLVNIMQFVVYLQKLSFPVTGETPFVLESNDFLEARYGKKRGKEVVKPSSSSKKAFDDRTIESFDPLEENGQARAHVRVLEAILQYVEHGILENPHFVRENEELVTQWKDAMNAFLSPVMGTTSGPGASSSSSSSSKSKKPKRTDSDEETKKIRTLLLHYHRVLSNFPRME